MLHFWLGEIITVFPALPADAKVGPADVIIITASASASEL
jgi:hypothetical protein